MRCGRKYITGTGTLLLTTLFWAKAAIAQMAGTRVPGGCDVLASKRTSEVGCYLIATEPLNALPAMAVFWHLYIYPTRVAAETAQKVSAGTAVESLGKIWLFMICGFEVATALRRACRGDRSSPRDSRQAIYSAVHASSISSEASFADGSTSPFRSRGLVRSHRRAMLAHARRGSGHSGRRGRPRTAGSFHAAHEHRHGDTPCSVACVA